MDENNMHVNDRKTGSNINGSVRRGHATSNLSIHSQGTPTRPSSLMESHGQHPGSYTIVQVVVIKDEKGYGMKVSGDNPVYVQSVKAGGAAEKAGLYAGDKIIEVNGENVMSSTHTAVVALIRSASQVVLTVQQSNRGKRMESPSLQQRPLTSPASHQITGPQPVDHEKLYQLQLQKKRHIELMIEKEERYLEQLRSQLALSPTDKKYAELEKTKRNLLKLEGTLRGNVPTVEQSPPSFSTSHNFFNETPTLFNDSPANTLPAKFKSRTLPNVGTSADAAPPLPKRNRKSAADVESASNHKNSQYVNGRSFPKPTQKHKIINSTYNNNGDGNSNNYIHKTEGIGRMKNNHLLQSNPNRDQSPPPLPPRNPRPLISLENDVEAANSISKQMSYPLVTTCATLIDNYPINHTHHRTKSSPESLLIMTPAEASRRLIASESLTYLGPDNYNENATPPGTPPPPYPNASPETHRRYSVNRNSELEMNEDNVDLTFSSSLKESAVDFFNKTSVNSSDIQAASTQISQQQIMSMEDDDMSDQEVNQLDDHGPFKSLSRLWEHTPHLAVFMNYTFLNSDPNSLLFYLLTDLYKEGNAKDMRKWAYEIHSSFLVPGAPLRLPNVDENIAHEIDDVLLREFDKEEILRKIFWKPRIRAKEELTRQLTQFQQKRIAGLGTMYGPADSVLFDLSHDKAKETKMYEHLLVDKLELYLEEIEKEHYDPKKYYTAAALATVIFRTFGVRSVPPLDRFPTFVNKEKSFRPKFMNIKYSRKLTIQGHQFTAQQYYTVIVCNHCHQIVYGIGPQGYQCSVCLINLHRTCVRLYEDSCPGPISKKDRGIQKVMEKISHRRKPSSQSHLDRRQDEKDNADNLDVGDMKPSQSLSRTDSDRRPDAKPETPTQDGHNHSQDAEEELANMENTKSVPVLPDKKKNASSVTRSESVKESSEKQRKKIRNISDPLHNTSDSGNLDTADFTLQTTLQTDSTRNSSNSSINSNSRSSNENPTESNTGCDSDGGNIEVLYQSSLSEQELQNLPPHEKERQTILNELFHTERSHVRNLNILDRIFLRNIRDKSLLKEDEMQLIFPNLPEILKIHAKFKQLLRSKKRRDGIMWRDMGDVFLAMFGGELGENFQKAAASFCEKQQCALDLIQEKRRKDSKFNMGLNELERHSDCRRLTFQGFMVSEMQRLAKYPMLIERYIGIIEKNVNSQDVEYSEVELANLVQALDRSKKIVNHVNEATNKALCQFRLEEIQNHLDTSLFASNKEVSIVNEFKNIYLPDYNLLHEGPVMLKRQNKAHLHVHMLLLEEAVVLLQKEGDRFLLKFFQNAKPGLPPLTPIIKMSTLIVRTNAACESSLFLVSNSAQQSYMHELLTRDTSERSKWFNCLSSAVNAFKKSEGKTKLSEPLPDDEETVVEIPNMQDAIERAEAVGSGDSSVSESENATKNFDNSSSNSESANEEKAPMNEKESLPVDTDTTGGGVSTKFTTDDWPLIQPSEVHADIPPVHSADAVLTPLEQIKRKDEEVRKALEDKEKLVADLLNIPRDDYRHIADMATEESKMDEIVSREPTELVLASLYQVDQLLKAVNESLTVTDADPVLLKGGKNPSCTSNKKVAKDFSPYASIMHGVQEKATTLNSLLTQLMSVLKPREEEVARLRKELERTREIYHAKLLLECSSQYVDVMEDVPPVDTIPPGDLESIEESLAENDTN